MSHPAADGRPRPGRRWNRPAARSLTATADLPANIKIIYKMKEKYYLKSQRSALELSLHIVVINYAYIKCLRDAYGTVKTSDLRY